MATTGARTWDQEARPHLIFRAERGDVALAVLWNLLEQVMPRLPLRDGMADRLAVVGNLRTPLGISWFIRGLLLMPHLRYVVIWGSDLAHTGDGLLKLWAEGMTEDGRVPAYGWKLDPAIDRAILDELRRYVHLVDARGHPLEELEELIHRLPRRSPERPALTLPPVTVPDRLELPSRGATVPIIASDPGEGWLAALDLVMRAGSVRGTRKDEVIAHYFNVIVYFPVPPEETIPPAFEMTPVDLEAYASKFIARQKPEGVDYSYGSRMQDWRGHDQLAEVIARLRQSPETKRATISLLDAADLSTLEDAPCLVTITFSIGRGELHGSYVFRSHDLYGGWPYNVMALLRLHRHVATQVGVGPGSMTVISQNAQIYERHWPSAKERIERYGKTLERYRPRWRQDPAGNFVLAIEEDGTVRVTHTSPGGDEVYWEARHRNPSILIGWIVETMPWLDRQHVRYLGREEQKIIQALKQGPPYLYHPD